MRTPLQRWGTCCPFDPECDHSFMDVETLARWLDSPIDDDRAWSIASDEYDPEFEAFEAIGGDDVRD